MLTFLDGKPLKARLLLRGSTVSVHEHMKTFRQKHKHNKTQKVRKTEMNKQEDHQGKPGIKIESDKRLKRAKERK